MKCQASIFAQRARRTLQLHQSIVAFQGAIPLVVDPAAVPSPSADTLHPPTTLTVHFPHDHTTQPQQPLNPRLGLSF
jgi:hypothetical protein